LRLTSIVGFLFCITAQVIDLKNDELEVIDLKNDELEVIDLNNDQLMDEIPKQQKVTSRLRRSTKQLPTRITFKTDIGITPNLYNQFPSKAEVDKWVRNLVMEANKLFSDPSLATTLTIQLRNIKRVDYNLPSGLTGDFMKKYNKNNYHLGVLGLGSGNGMAFTGSACHFSKHKQPFVIYPDDYFNGANFVIKLHPGSNSNAALLAHEIGHVIGMNHNHQVGCSGVWDGLMHPFVSDYSNKWTSCNNKQLREHYDREGYLCL